MFLIRISPKYGPEECKNKDRVFSSITLNFPFHLSLGGRTLCWILHISNPKSSNFLKDIMTSKNRLLE